MWRNDISGPDMCMWRNDISGPDICGGMTYPDQMDVEEIKYPDQMYVEE
jgi:hypothetical protein